MTADRKRLYRAWTGYALLGGCAVFTLDQEWRIGVMVLLGALAFKSWLDVKRRELDQ